MPNPWKQKRSTIRHYNITAETYDQQYMEEQNLKITTALKALPRSIDGNSVILDAGCGTGILFPHIARKAKQVIGVDTAPNLLKQAKTKAATNTALIRADADFLPLKANTFTHTFALTLLQNTPNPKRTIEEIKRATCQDPTLIITGLKKHFAKTVFTKLLENAQLDILALRTDEKLKDFVAVCRKHS